MADTGHVAAAPGSAARSATLMVALRAVSRGIGVVSTAILARLLTPDDFGLVVLGSAVLNVAQMLSELSLSAALVRMARRDLAHYDTAWTLGVLRAALVAIVVVLVAGRVAEAMHEPRVVPILWTLSAATLIQVLESIRLIDYQIDLRFDGVFRYQLLARTSSFLVTLALAVILRSYWALVISTLATSLVTVVYSYVLAPHRPRLTLAAWRDLFGFSKWAVLGSYLAVIENYSITFLLGWLYGTRILGLYQVSTQIASLPASEIAAPIRAPLYAAFSRLQHDRAEMARLFIEGFGFLFLVITPMSLGIFATSKMIAPLALGPQWPDAPAMIEAVVFYALFDAIGHYPQNLFVVLNRQARLLVFASAFVLIRVPTAIAGGWLAGPVGAAYGMTATTVFGAIFWFTVSLPLLHLRPGPILAAIWRTALSGAVMLTALLLLRGIWPAETTVEKLLPQLLLFVLAGAALHLGTLALLWKLAGSPPGAEARALGIASRFLRRR